MSDDASKNTPVTPPAPTSTRTAELLEEMLSEARKEAADTRVKAKAKVEQTKAEVTQEFEAKLAESNTAHDATKASLAEAQLEVERLKAAIESKVPHEHLLNFSGLLKGKTAEELKAHADTLKGMFGIKAEDPPPVDPTAGSGNGVLPLNGDPILKALENALNRKH